MLRRTHAIALSVLIAAGGLAGLVAFWPDPEPRVVVTGTADVGGPFTLTAHTGERISDEAFRGKYMLVAFGFTHCPDVCPAQLQVMSAALDDMGPEAERIQPVFITIDPERDTAAAMKDYLSSFDPHLKGLTGNPEAVAKVLSSYRVYARKVPLRDGDYTMDHTALVYLMDRDGKFVSPFNLKRTPQEAATDLKRHL